MSKERKDNEKLVIVKIFEFLTAERSPEGVFRPLPIQMGNYRLQVR